jgi:hypothetical protein
MSGAPLEENISGGIVGMMGDDLRLDRRPLLPIFLVFSWFSNREV